jgi:hypothetical protein
LRSFSNTLVARSPVREDIHLQRGTLATPLIDYGKHAQPPAIGQTVVKEIDRSQTWLAECGASSTTGR